MLKAALFALALLAPMAVPASCVLPGNADQITALMTQMMNDTRAANGLAALAPNRRLMRAAADHGCDMSQHAFFGHRGSDGADLQARVTRTGYGLCLAAENLAYGYDPGEIVPRWMGSPGHRANLLQDRAAEFGNAVVMGPDGPMYVLVMARPC